MKNNTVNSNLTIHVAKQKKNFRVLEISNSAYAKSWHSLSLAKNKTVKNTSRHNMPDEILTAHQPLC
jgi:hypothetical protein